MGIVVTSGSVCGVLPLHISGIPSQRCGFDSCSGHNISHFHHTHDTGCCGSNLDQENQSIMSHNCWDPNIVKHCHSSMHSQAVMQYQWYLELAKRLHGIHGSPFLKSQTLSMPSSKTQPISHSTHFICNIWSDGWYSLHSKNWSPYLVNESRKLRFTHSLRSLDSLPPTQHAVFQHAKHALLTAAFVWKQSV